MDLGKIVRIVIGLVCVGIVVVALVAVAPSYMGAGDSLRRATVTGFENNAAHDYDLSRPSDTFAFALEAVGVDVRSVAYVLATAVLAVAFAALAFFVFRKVFGE